MRSLLDEMPRLLPAAAEAFVLRANADGGTGDNDDCGDVEEGDRCGALDLVEQHDAEEAAKDERRLEDRVGDRIGQPVVRLRDNLAAVAKLPDRARDEACPEGRRSGQRPPSQRGRAAFGFVAASVCQNALRQPARQRHAGSLFSLACGVECTAGPKRH